MKKNIYKGMSLVEMIVAIAIFTIGISGFTALFIKGWKSNSFIIESAEATRAAERALTEISEDMREIRQADDGSFGIKSAADFDVVFFANVDSDELVERVHYFLDLDTDTLKKGVSKPSGTPVVYPVGDTTVEEIGYYVVNDASVPLFYYYDNDETLLSSPINLADISLIRVLVKVNIKPEIAPENVNVESLIQIRNFQT